MYADDMQLYLQSDLYNDEDELATRKRMESCIVDIQSWMTSNKLKFNDDKTELIKFSIIWCK